ncbi:EscU/YscU/HrcU family type III secretion system export apparatus switch protein [Treponema sp.]|uniref:EscU/YscU/HrcU family type III secretion system export apparatus switch protein n=1 Tax=Treponema sp. TaxID=166 RepID=UPI0025DA90C2|nr:EscU/YscU/HrcU family type III secretion system export apparatus switch protein [Treponema sp.]MCR5217240.1 EscU/YscU/HrcU family type III secretion system export apparatus switch protein [Treponema sp.]
MSQIDLQWFAAEDEGRTEKPSEHSLQEARKKGEIAKSAELSSAIVWLFAILLLIVLAPWMETQFEQVLVYFFNNINSRRVDDSKFYYIFLFTFLKMVLPFGLVGITAGVIANIVQNKGWLFTPSKIQPKFSNIIPHVGRYLKKTIFSLQGVFNIFKSILKVVIISVIAFFFIRSDMEDTLNFLHTGGIDLAQKQVGLMTAKLLVVSAVLMVIIGVADYIVQRREFMEQHKMSKQQVKEEFKSLEGDPETKARLERSQREMLTQNIRKAVSESDVVITNPEHYAVALEWKKEVADAPQVTAKGEDMTAQTIKRIARENDVPTVENRSLARGLYNDTQVGDVIPVDYLKAIATVYAQIGYMSKNKG